MGGAAYPGREADSTLTTGGNPRDGTPLLKHADSGAAETFEVWSSLTSKSLASSPRSRGFCFAPIVGFASYFSSSIARLTASLTV
jgi:hypothetical protein